MNDIKLTGDFSMDDLIKKVVEWTRTNNLDNSELKFKQLTKIAEEFGEVAKALIVNHELDNSTTQANLKLEIGDLLHTIIVLCEQLGFDTKNCLKMSVDKNAVRYRDYRDIIKGA